MDLTSLSWDSFMSFFIFCSVTFFPCNAHYMKQREFSLLDLLSPAIWKQKNPNNVKDYTPPAIWSCPQETSLLFLRVITRWLLHEGTLQWGSALLGAKIWKLRIRDSLKTKKVHNNTSIWKKSHYKNKQENNQEATSLRENNKLLQGMHASHIAHKNPRIPVSSIL